jgi:hypothetical protein
VAAGILLTSLLFGIAHVDPPSIVATAFLGFLLHYVYIMSRSLWLPILLHSLNNSLGVLSAHVPELESAEAPPAYKLAIIAVGGIGLLAAVGWAMYRSRVGFQMTGEGDAPPWQPLYPGVAHPPPDANTVVVRPWPGWLAAGLVVLAAAWFGAFIFLAVVLP